MKIAVSNIAWSEKHDFQMYCFLRDHGISGIEIAPTRLVKTSPYEHIDAFVEIRDRLRREYGLQIVSMQSIWYGKTERIFGQKEEREALLKYTEKAIRVANRIDCNNIVFGCPKNRIINSSNDYDIALDFFSEVGDISKKFDVVFSIEANPVIYGTNFLNTTEEVFRFVKKLNHPNVAVNYDLGTAIANNEDISTLERDISWIHHVHISEPGLGRVLLGRLHNDLSKVLADAAYNRYVSLEMRDQDNLTLTCDTINAVQNMFGK